HGSLAVWHSSAWRNRLRCRSSRRDAFGGRADPGRDGLSENSERPLPHVGITLGGFFPAAYGGWHHAYADGGQGCRKFGSGADRETGLNMEFSHRTRAEAIARFKRSAAEPGQEFDLLVIGGGITGAGTARDAASRGLKVALLEKNDFASGTSSRSSKLI